MAPIDRHDLAHLLDISCCHGESLAGRQGEGEDQRRLARVKPRNNTKNMRQLQHREPYQNLIHTNTIHSPSAAACCRRRGKGSSSSCCPCDVLVKVENGEYLTGVYKMDMDKAPFMINRYILCRVCKCVE